jgi:hypothetical protein
VATIALGITPFMRNTHGGHKKDCTGLAFCALGCGSVVGGGPQFEWENAQNLSESEQ